jgi:hypothetical protein
VRASVSPSRLRIGSYAALLVAARLLWSPPARALEGGYVWGIGTTVVVMPIAVAAIVSEPGHGPNATGGERAVYYGTTLLAIAIPTTVGFVAHAHSWDTTVPRAASLGLWSGATGLMIGAALSAKPDDDAFIAHSPLPWVMGGVGLVAGAAYGAFQTEMGTTREEALLATGAMVFVAGTVPAVIDAGFHAATDGPGVFQRRFRRDLAIGMTVGLAAGFLTMVLSSNEPRSKSSATSATSSTLHLGPSATPLPGGGLLSYGGVF